MIAHVRILKAGIGQRIGLGEERDPSLWEAS